MFFYFFKYLYEVVVASDKLFIVHNLQSYDEFEFSLLVLALLKRPTELTKIILFYCRLKNHKTLRNTYYSLIFIHKNKNILLTARFLEPILKKF